MNKKSLVRLCVPLWLVLSGASSRAQEAVLAPPPAPLPPTVQTPAVPPTPSTPPTPRTPQTPPTPPVAALAPDAPGVSYFFTGDNFLGVYTEEVTRENMSRYNVREARGVGVRQVVKGSPAERAGLRENDVILRFDGEAITGIRKLNRLIGEAPPEHAARLSISRNGSEQEISVTLAEGKNFSGMFGGEGFRLTPEQSKEWRERTEQWRQRGEDLGRQGEGMARRGEEARRRAEELMRNNPNLFAYSFGASRRIGVATSPLTRQLADYFGVDDGRGVLVSSVTQNSPASRAGLRAGDVITEIDGERVGQASDISRIVNRKKDGEITLTVVRDKKRRTMRVMPEQSQTQSMDFLMDEIALAPLSIKLPRIDIETPKVQITPPVINLSPLRLNINPRLIAPEALRPLSFKSGSVLL